jgi:hypothetical protein
MLSVYFPGVAESDEEGVERKQKLVDIYIGCIAYLRSFSNCWIADP